MKIFSPFYPAPNFLPVGKANASNSGFGKVLATWSGNEESGEIRNTKIARFYKIGRNKSEILMFKCLKQETKSIKADTHKKGTVF